MNRKAFTLIETLIAMVLLAGALIVLGVSNSGSLGAIRKSRSLTTLSLLMQKKITEYEIKYRDSSGDVPELEEGDFGEEFPQFKWKMESQKVQMPNFSAALTARNGGATETELMVAKQLQDMIENSVKELKLTVFWKNGDKDLEYAVTTYLVEYEKTALPGGAATPQNPAAPKPPDPNKGGS